MSLRPSATMPLPSALLPPQSIELARWLRAIADVGADARLRLDSRSVRPGDAFVAAPGGATDGRRYIGAAIAAGARAVLWDPVDGFGWPDGLPAVAQRPVADAHRVSGPVAAALLGVPSEPMAITAFTGTNGKTSCSQWFARLLERDGTPCGIVGTLGAGRPDALQPFGLTTPEAADLQAMLADWAGEGIGAVAIEASSIGLDVGRLDGTRIRTAVFTNLSRDHLDFHGTDERYAEAKARLFSWPRLEHAVVNCDDPAADRMLSAAGAAVQRIGFRTDDSARGGMPAARVDAWLLATRVEPLEGGGSRIDLDGDWGRGSFTFRPAGRFNAANALAVAGAALARGLGFEQVLDGLSRLAPVPGRMETIAQRAAPLVVVDYAHTPDALAQVLAALRPAARARGGRLWCVFGAGGDRDPGKRPLMGAAVAAGADTIVVTSDNPRSEDPARIAASVLEGVRATPGASDARLELDRRAAIRAAVLGASAADVVLVAGKGHETSQEIAGVRHPFRDADEARAALCERAPAAPGRRTDGGRDAT